jgi:large subunit ribosomal protein L18
MVGETIGKKAVELGVKTAVFDRRSYKFHGRVKGVAEGAKKSGLTI